MLPEANILPLIKEQVQAVLPDARVLLFGSRVTGKVHAESDWDILILTKTKYPKSVKWLIHDKLFHISIAFATFINIMMVQEDDWHANPGYYALKKNIGENFVAA
ncbi:MAG: nucleotidyltransferase domain-containing protein [Chitinophagaceae bacterium]|nr:nucleotidyltransferase domain-containing protein [Chitinophagaceae bacterium]